MAIELSVEEYSIRKDTIFYEDLVKENKKFPAISMGRDSYIVHGYAVCEVDEAYLYDIQVGRYTSIADGCIFLIDMNHDYKRVAQGRIGGIPYRRPENVRRKGQIIIGNDCWLGRDVSVHAGVHIGDGAVVAANSVVTKDVPPYAMVGGNPAKIIGYRFENHQIEALRKIAWWYWDEDKILSASNLLTNADIDAFINTYLEEAKRYICNIEKVDIQTIEKSGEGRIYYYIPDFEQDYPTYPAVISEYINKFSDTNNELLLYVEDDDFVDDKLNVLNQIFSEYEDNNCYVNLFIGHVKDQTSILSQVDYYITNRSIDNVKNVSAASHLGLKCIQSVSLPIFDEHSTGYMVR